jgi:hypothetical protein
MQWMQWSKLLLPATATVAAASDSDENPILEYVRDGHLVPDGYIDLTKGFCIYSKNGKKQIFTSNKDMSQPLVDSSVRFILIECITSDHERIKFDLDEGYYVAGNVLSLDFYRYLLTNKNIRTVCYLDAECRMFEATSLRLLRDSYEIITNAEE